MMENTASDNGNDRPALLKAIEIVLADPSEIMMEARTLHEKFRSKYADDKSDDEIAALVADKIISNYSYYAAFVGGATALTGVVPGLGTVIASFGGATADAALSMKYQIEMTMALAVVYGHDITTEEKKRVCLIVAGLGAIGKAAKTVGKAFKEGGKAVGRGAKTAGKAEMGWVAFMAYPLRRAGRAGGGVSWV